MQYLFGIFSMGMISIVPLLLAGVVIIDVLRTGANRYWIMVVLFFPFVGPIAYLLVERSPWFGAGTAALSPTAAKRRGARRRLQELQVQLGHWRGPALLVEAGENLLLLGKTQQAEAHLREAREAGAEPELVNLPLARALTVQGKLAEAVPLLEELHEREPDFKRGEADLALARCLDEAGRSDEAEAVLRRVLEMHHFPEAQVRLARICRASKRREEADRLLDTVISDIASLPRQLMRQHRPWLRAARRLKRGRTNLPKVADPASERKRRLLIGVAVAAAAAVLIVGTVGVWLWLSFRTLFQDAIGPLPGVPTRLSQLADLDDRYPWPHAVSLAMVDLSPEEITSYLQIRQTLQPQLVTADRAHQDYLRFQERMLQVAVSGPGREGVVDDAEREHDRWTYSREELYSALRRVLEEQQLGPESLARYLTIIEWRFLGRDEAVVFGLSRYERDQWLSAASVLRLQDLGGSEGSLADRLAESQRRRSREEMATLKRAAQGNRQLSETTLQVLEEQRSALEALDTTGLEQLLCLVDARFPIP